MDNTNKIESMAADLHLLAAPFRFILAAVKVLLFTLSFPLLCGLVMLSYTVPGIDPLMRYLEFVKAHNVPLVVYPFVVLGALLLLAVDMLIVIAKDVAGMVDILLRVPLLGTALFALASTFWLIVVKGSLSPEGWGAKSWAGPNAVPQPSSGAAEQERSRKSEFVACLLSSICGWPQII